MAASSAEPRWTIYTFGYDGISSDLFIKTLKDFKIATLMDVRVSPNSNTSPQYKLKNIKKSCLENDIKYTWKGQQFGGIHQTNELIQKLSDNSKENASFFLRSTFNLIEHPVVIMCSESKMEDCSRRHIADALISYNLAKIKHIFIDIENDNKVNCYDYVIDKELTKIKVSETKYDDEDEKKPLPNDTIMVNKDIKFMEKIPKEMSKSDFNGFKSSLCIIPPSEIWPKIQEIRRIHDAAYERWQPHLNVLYPFIDEKYYESQLKYIQDTLSEIKPFEIIFRRFNYFDKGGSEKDPDPLCHVFLQPAPADSIAELQKIYNALIGLYPFCESKKHRQGFMGHLTVAQFPRSKCIEYVKTMNAEWEPISFKCDGVYLIARIGDDNPFNIRYKVGLGLK